MHRPSYHAKFLRRDLLQFLQRHRLITDDRPTLLAVSGGLDSTVLVHVFAAAGLSFGLGHVNYQLRGTESDDDETFVRELARHFGVAVYVKKISGKTLAEESDTSLQAAARTFRYAQLTEWQRAHGYGRIATAHHGDDSVETTVANFIRGTGLAGLRGILPRQDVLIRPLLFTRRAVLEAYAEQHGIAYRTDRSNADTKYTRNRIRHELIPMLTRINPNFAARNLASQQHLREADWLRRFALNQLLEQLLESTPGGERLAIAPLQNHPAARSLLHAWLGPVGFNESQLSQLYRHLNSSSGGTFTSGSHQLRVKRGYLYLTPL